MKVWRPDQPFAGPQQIPVQTRRARQAGGRFAPSPRSPLNGRVLFEHQSRGDISTWNRGMLVGVVGLPDLLAGWSVASPVVTTFCSLIC